MYGRNPKQEAGLSAVRRMAERCGGSVSDPEHTFRNLVVFAEGKRYGLSFVCRCGNAGHIAGLDRTSAAAAVISLIALSTPEAFDLAISALGNGEEDGQEDW